MCCRTLQMQMSLNQTEKHLKQVALFSHAKMYLNFVRRFHQTKIQMLHAS